MEAFTFILLIIILILLITLRNSLLIRIDGLKERVDKLIEENKKSILKEEGPLPRADTKSIAAETIAHKTPAIQTEVVKETEEIKKAPEEFKKPIETIKYPDIIQPAISHKPLELVTVPPQTPAKPGFFERNPDLEKFIGENLANKIGIGILVLGIGFFVKYAIDQDWINEIGRVFIGILCGGILLAVAHRMRKKFAAFSSVLVGGGIAVLYLTIAIAFHEYKLFSQTAAFILMLGITAFSVILSLSYNRIELAILSILGGFASPFMVSTGEGNYIVLFSYILILDVGMLVLAYYKKWNLVNIISYIFTVLLFASWLGAKFKGDDISIIRGALIFATLFYLVFFAMNIVNNIKEKAKFKGLEISLLLSNTFFYYAAGMVILNNIYGNDFKGLFTASLGIFNFIFAYTLYKSTRADKNLVFLLIGLVLTFISLAAPIQLEGNYITLFWAAETVLLLWLSQKSGIKLMKLASFVVMGLMVISLLMDWQQLYTYFDENNILSVVFNKGYITSVFALASIASTFYLLKYEPAENTELVNVYKVILTLGGITLLYVSQFLELKYQLLRYIDDYVTREIIIGTYNMLFILALLITSKKLAIPEAVKKAFPFWGIIAMMAYLTHYHTEVIAARNSFLMEEGSLTGFTFHYGLVLVLILIAILSLKRIQLLTEFNQKTYHLYSWIYVFFFLFLASAELDHAVVLIGFTNGDSINHLLTQNHKIGYPILWGLTSFILIAVGLKTKKKHLRIISLSLFLITLVKLFTVDIKNITEGGKIAAFISLGILLLTVSFMYQRLKRLLLADESEKENPV